MIKQLASLLYKDLTTLINSRMEELKGKVTKNGKPYSTQWVEEELLLLGYVGSKGLAHILENLVSVMRSSSEQSPMSIHQLIGSLIPREIKYLETEQLVSRMGQWCSLLLTCLVQRGVIKESRTKIATVTLTNPYAGVMDGFYLNTHLTDLGIEIPSIKSVSDKPKATNKTLGSIWCKDGKELDHCSSTINLLNETPLTFKKEVMDMLDNKFHLSEAKKEKWNKDAFSTFEEYVKAREDAFESYVSKLPKYINNIAQEGDTVFNTYAPDSRGRLYPTSDVGNFVGIKQVRATIAFSDGCYVNSQEDDF